MWAVCGSWGLIRCLVVFGWLCIGIGALSSGLTSRGFTLTALPLTHSASTQLLRLPRPLSFSQLYCAATNELCAANEKSKEEEEEEEEEEEGREEENGKGSLHPLARSCHWGSEPIYVARSQHCSFCGRAKRN